MPYKDPEKEKEYQREYQRKWRKTNKHYHKKWRAANPDYETIWRQNNRHRTKATQARYRRALDADLVRKKRLRISKNEWNKRNRASINAKYRTNNEFQKAVKVAYGCLHPKCSWYGEWMPEMLDFHHLDPSNKKFLVSRMKYKKRSIIIEEVNKCTVLCAVCHRAVSNGKWSDEDCIKCNL